MNHRLHELAPCPLHLIWHENKTTYLSVKKERRRLSLRVHRLFFDAPTPVLEALLHYALKGDRDSLAILKQMAHLHFSQNHIAPDPLSSQGKIYDLQEILDRSRQIIPVADVSIGWSNRRTKSKFRSMTFGTYDKHSRQIRIHPLLDDPDVPLYFLEFIVYHELLHAVCPSKMDIEGRCSVHTREFRDRERQFPRFHEAKEWEKTSLKYFKRKSHGRP
jgi:hypothetical protein